MNLSTPYRGTFRRVPTDQYAHDVLLEIPILFTRVSTGPSGLVDVVAVRLELGGTRYELSQDLTLHALSRVPEAGDSGASLRGDTIRRRPASFQPDGDDNNPMVAALHAMPAGEGADPLPRDGKVPMVLQLHLLFTNMAPVPIEIRGEIHPASGLVTLDPRPKRVTSPVLTNANLIALGVLCSLLFAWHTFFNDDVYEQTRFAQQMVPALLGSLVTFLGLSVGRIKGWLGALVDTLSVLEYPELHFNPALTRRVGTRWFSAGVGVFAVTAAVLVGWHWSVEASTESSKLAIYDTHGAGKLVENERISWRDMRDDPERFGTVCVENGKPAEKPYLLAYQRGRHRVPVMVKVVEVDPFATDEASTRTTEQGGEAWVEGNALQGDLPELIRRILCESELSEPTVLAESGGLVVKPIETRDPLRREFQVSREWIWESADFTKAGGPFPYAWRRFPDYDFSALFEQRDEVFVELDSKIESFLAIRDEDGVRSILPISDVIALSIDLLDEVSSGREQKRTLERAILIRSLWRASKSRQERDATDAELEGIATATKKLLQSDLGTKVSRALLEMVLEIQKQNEGTDVLHRATVAAWDSEPSEHRYPNVVDYLVHALALDAARGAPLKFFEDEWNAIQGWNPTRSEFGDWLELRNLVRKDGFDPTLDFAVIRRHLRRLESQIQSERFEQADGRRGGASVRAR